MINTSNILAIKAERRIVSLAIFTGGSLRYAQALQLSSKPEAAAASAREFVFRHLARFNVRWVFIEDAIGSEETRAGDLIDLLDKAIQESGTPTQRVSKQTLFDAYAVTPLNTRRELYALIVEFWPQLNTADFHPSVLDAAAVGLYARTERLLTLNESPS